MNIENRITHYLDSQHIHYQLIPHTHSRSSIGSAISAEVPMHKLAKAVMLEDHDGKHVMAILPANYKLSLGKLNDEFNRNFKLVKEAQVYQMFSDCSSGAVPPLLNAYHMDTIYDEALEDEAEIYFESGDHETLLLIDGKDFKKMMSAYKHARFSHKAIH